MAPTLLPGDRLLVVRARRARAGAIVVVRDPRDSTREVVKRLTEMTPDGRLVVHGDNGHASTDSRTYGPLPPGLLVGRALYRYAPPARAGWLRPAGRLRRSGGSRHRLR